LNKLGTITISTLLLVSVFFPCFISAPVTAQTPEPIKIGVFIPITNGLVTYGPWTKQGFELGMIYATTEMGYNNENKTSAGRPYEITYYDTQGSATLAPSLVTSAIEDDGIDIIVGGTSSAVAAAIAPVAESYKKLYFITPAADASLTASLFNPYVFRLARNSWHDAYAGVTYAMDTLNYTKFGFLAIDYSFGRSGVAAMTSVIEAKGGVVNSIQYAPLGTSDFGPYLTNLIYADALFGIDYLFIVWAGTGWSEMYRDFAGYHISDYMEVAGSNIDIESMTLLQLSLIPPATFINSTGLCLYGYELPNNPVNDWMVAEHITRNIQPDLPYYSFTFRAPELFTASAFATAQFLVNVTNAIPDLNTNLMINHLESGLTINCPKGPTYLRPQDHQGLAEMYIAKAVNDTRPGSETHNLIIAQLVETLDRNTVAPPIASVWNGNPYVPGGFAPTTTTSTGTTTTTTTGVVTPVDWTLVIVAGAGVAVVIIVIAAIVMLRKK
jgi:branched-chain amino acid transport system substrate-binding protein